MDIFMTNNHFEFGIRRESGSGELGSIYHQHLGLFIMLKGCMDVYVDDKFFEVSGGQAVFFLSRQFHNLVFPKKEACHFIWCGTGIMPNKAFDGSLESLIMFESAPNVFPPSKNLFRLLLCGCKLRNRHGFAAQRIRNTLGESVFNEYLYITKIEEEERLIPIAAIKAKRYLTENFSDPNCTPSQAARVSSVSDQHLSKLFKKHLSCTPRQYLLTKRIDKALRLLKHTNLRIYQVAEECGFKNKLHLSRHINRYCKASPQEVRKKIMQEAV